MEVENARLRAENIQLERMAAGQCDGEEVKTEIEELSARLEELRVRVGM